MNGYIERVDGDAIHITPKCMDVLVHLAIARGNCVTREELIERVWERSFVQEEALTRVIADLRRALGDSGRSPTLIVTVPKRGYRLVAPVSAHRCDAHDRVNTKDSEAGLENGASESRNEPSLVHAETVREENQPGSTEFTEKGTTITPPGSRRVQRWILPALALVTLIGLATGLIRRDWAGKTDADRSRDDLVTRIATAHPVISDANHQLTPRWIDDGKTILFVERSAAGPIQSSIKLLDLSSRKTMTLTQEDADDRCPTMSRNKRMLAWARIESARCSIMFKSMAESSVFRVADCRQVAPYSGCPEFTPDSLYLIYADSKRSERDGFVRRNLATGVETEIPIVGLTQPGEAGMPRISPDGSTIAFEVTEHGQEGSVYVAPLLDTLRPVRLQKSVQGNHGYDFSPTQGDLLISTDAVDFPGLVAWPLGSASDPLRIGQRGARHPSVASSGAVAFENRVSRINIWVGRSGSATLDQVTGGGFHDALPSFSADGRQFLFNSNQSGRESVWLGDARTGVAEQLPLDPAKRWIRPSWGGTPEVILASQAEIGGYRGCEYSRASGEVTCPEAWVDAVRVEQVGTWGHVVEHVRDDLRTLTLSSRNGVSTRIASGEGPLDWKVDGYDVVVVTEVGFDVFSLSPEGEVRRDSLSPREPVSPGLWAMASGKIFYLSRQLDSFVVVAVGVHDGVSLPSSLPALPLDVRSFDVAEDGTEILVERPTSLTIDLYVSD